MVPSAHGDRTPLPPTFPDLRSLELFTSVCRLGSLSAAAVVHGIAQPSASARIRSLERQVGVSLLQRSATGSTPTHNGVLVAEWADRFLDAADELHVALGTLTRSPSAPVTIAASYTIAEFLLPGWLGVWRRTSDRGAELAVVNSTEVLSRVSHGDAELGFVETTGSVGALNSSEVGRDELVAVVAPTHRLATRGRPLHPAEFSAIGLVCRESGSGTRDAGRRTRRSRSRTPHAVARAGFHQRGSGCGQRWRRTGGAQPPDRCGRPGERLADRGAHLGPGSAAPAQGGLEAGSPDPRRPCPHRGGRAVVTATPARRPSWRRQLAENRPRWHR